ncbi:MAG: bifunctional riboflavin kinase/FAD synthetase [Deltaproteobacteria bacterium]|nr:bifunctional riboflavin kinase/FAD synthetase [Deltaproteobacteria bacterium]
MRVFEGSESVDDDTRGCVLTVGNFDGLHLGHQALISAVTERARELGRPAGLYTFDPHPRRVLYPERAPRQLMIWEQVQGGIEERGIDRLIREPFTREFAAYSADEFLSEVIHKRIAPCEIFVGRDFHFGKDRSGSGEMLARLAPDLGIRVGIIAQVRYQDRDVSSSRIRELIAEGAVEEAAGCLGHIYAIRGTVVTGDRRGRTLGFPTANLEPDNELIPANGVYATRVRLLDAPGAGAEHDAVTNVGTRPTFEPGRVLTEAHLLDFEGDLYGQRIELRFLRRIRDERRFSGPDELKEQIAKDASRVREILGADRT